MRKLRYDPSYISFITTITKYRRPVFHDVALAERLGTMIHMACRSKGFVPLAYAILPDHVHLLLCSQTMFTRALESARSTIITNSTQKVEGGLSSPPDFTIAEIMKSIKGTFSRTLQPGPIWQRGYFHWYVADADEVKSNVQYILHNFRKSYLPERYGREPYVWCDHATVRVLLS